MSWASLTTLAGSLTAIWVAHSLTVKFSGKGLVPDTIVNTPTFLFAVGLSAAATVFLATLVGLPISTTHSLIGALVGAGLIHAAGNVAVSRIGITFLAPLLFSPVMAMFLAGTVDVAFRALRSSLRIDNTTCICVGEMPAARLLPAVGYGMLKRLPIWQPYVGSAAECRRSDPVASLEISAAKVLDLVHYLSAGAVSFARGLNDTPKIAGLLLALHSLPPLTGNVTVAVVMLLGGWLAARRVAETMSCKITRLSPGQGFSANIATALLVIGASAFALPVSTTHVSSGALFGIALFGGRPDRRVITSIVWAWVVTLPLAAVLAGGISALLLAGS